jgi:hypothetical protein
MPYCMSLMLLGPHEAPVFPYGQNALATSPKICGPHVSSSFHFLPHLGSPLDALRLSPCMFGYGWLAVPGLSQAGGMQPAAVCLPADGPEHGLAHANSTVEPGSAGTQMKSASGEPGSLDARSYRLIMVLTRRLAYIK